MQCMNDLMINTTDGTCSCPAGRYAKDALDCADCNKGSYCPGGKYEGPGVPAQVPCGTGLTTEGQRSTSIYLCGECGVGLISYEAVNALLASDPSCQRQQ